MNIALSSAAAPRMSLQELIAGCARRGLTSLYLVEGHAHGIDAHTGHAALQDAAAHLTAGGIAVRGFEAAGVLPGAQAARIVDTLDTTIVMRNAPSRVELNVADGDVAADAQRFTRAGAGITHIVLRGGGPEAARYEGRGIGSLMTRLAFDNYGGTLILAPTSEAVLPVWRAWLNHGKSWGCGSKTGDESLVQLTEIA